MCFAEFELTDGTPVYLQIVSYIRRKAASGAAQAGESLPSCRDLAKQLKVNSNTVQKAYAYLANQGMLITSAGRRSTIRVTESDITTIKLEEAKTCVKRLAGMGMNKKEALELVECLWK